MTRYEPIYQNALKKLRQLDGITTRIIQDPAHPANQFMIIWEFTDTNMVIATYTLDSENLGLLLTDSLSLEGLLEVERIQVSIEDAVETLIELNIIKKVTQ